MAFVQSVVLLTWFAHGSRSIGRSVRREKEGAFLPFWWQGKQSRNGEEHRQRGGKGESGGEEAHGMHAAVFCDRATHFKRCTTNRGGIVDRESLVEVLKRSTIAGRYSITHNA